MLVSNMLRMEPEYWSGAAVGAGSIFYDLPHYTKEDRERLAGRPGPKDTLTDKPLYFYVGTRDNLVPHVGVEDTVDYFEPSGANIKYELVRDFHHCWPNSLPLKKPWNPFKTCGDIYMTDILYYGVASPKITFMNNCGFNLAYYALDHLFTNKKHPQELHDWKLDFYKSGKFLAIDQRPFQIKDSHMLDWGYLYIPDPCLDGEYCSLMVWLHGCEMSAPYHGDVVSRQTGLMQFAATNNMVVLFPQNDDYFAELPGYPPGHYCWRAWDTEDKDHPQI